MDGTSTEPAKVGGTHQRAAQRRWSPSENGPGWRGGTGTSLLGWKQHRTKRERSRQRAAKMGRGHQEPLSRSHRRTAPTDGPTAPTSNPPHDPQGSQSSAAPPAPRRQHRNALWTDSRPPAQLAAERGRTEEEEPRYLTRNEANSPTAAPAAPHAELGMWALSTRCQRGDAAQSLSCCSASNGSWGSGASAGALGIGPKGGFGLELWVGAPWVGAVGWSCGLEPTISRTWVGVVGWSPRVAAFGLRLWGWGSLLGLWGFCGVSQRPLQPSHSRGQSCAVLQQGTKGPPKAEEPSRGQSCALRTPNPPSAPHVPPPPPQLPSPSRGSAQRTAESTALPPPPAVNYR